MRSRHSIAIFALFMLLAVCCRSQDSNAHVAQPFSMALKSPSESHKVGEPITVGITVTNISKSVIGFEAGLGARQLERHFFVIANGPGGKAVEEREYGLEIHGRSRKNFGPRLGSSYMETLEPGKSVYHEIDVNKLYDFSVPGTYELYIQRDHEADSGLLVKSNHITIVVVE
jgi:hypothetical protein